MKKKTPNKHIYIEKVKNLYMDHQIELATITSIHIKEVEHFYIGKDELATTATSYDQSPTGPDHPSIPTLTNSQQVLAAYYVLENWGIRPRINVDIADIARFMHLLTGKVYTCVDNSVFYKKLKRAPNFKTDQGLIKDLEVLNKSLLAVDLKEVSLKVDKELQVARQEIKHSS